MKRLARIVGVVGGLAAVVWAMRDRFVSIAAPREPEPPTFRVVTPPSKPLRPEEPDDLTLVNGIGPVFARRLMEGGISTFAALGRASVSTVADITGVPESRVEDWITQAAART
jgi:polyhydroxyalkanoate synthase